MRMLIYLILQSRKKRTIVEYNDDVMQKCCEFIEYILPIMRKFLKIEGNPNIHIIDYFSNITQYAGYDHKNNTIYISINRMIHVLDCHNYYILLFNLASALTHELTHYRQYINGEYNLDKIIYIQPSIESMKEYRKQPIEKEAFRQGYLFIKKNKKLIKEKIDKINIKVS